MKGLRIILLIAAYVLSAQSTISGVINSYAKVTSINTTCNSVQTDNNSFFAVGDRVLLIQMKGASISTTNDATFGNISAINNAGNYEFNEVFDVQGSDVYLKYTMRPYTVSGLVQMITVPQYTDVEITGTLTAQAWNGNTGGVLVFEASGTVTMNADIDVSGLGFSKGVLSVNGGACGFFSAAKTGYAYDPTNADPNIASEGAEKGEGIAVSNLRGGRGKQANGGGGGNNHNNGGGGGANFGVGGNGGNKSSGCASTYPSAPGVGGVSLSSFYSVAENRIFFGGGGGRGQQNNNVGQLGGNGGGIVILRSNSINGNGNKIKANGQFGGFAILDNTSALCDFGDGAGGGGGGGTILLDVTNTNLNGVVTQANGGDGSYTCYAARNFGPGGGGGGGVVWIKDGSFPLTSQLDVTVAGGASGLSTGVSPTQNWGAAPGGNGASLNSLSIAQNPLFNQTCLITVPVKILSYAAVPSGASVDISWQVLSDDERWFIVERSQDAQHFQAVAQVAKNETGFYKVKDLMPYDGVSYYRLSMVKAGGEKQYAGLRKVNRSRMATSWILAPNPASGTVNIDGLLESAYVEVWDIQGKAMFQQEVQAGEPISLYSLAKGLYLLHIQSSQASEVLKLQVE
ncbi:MAG: T9SS type A sorting domain-containing protein [Cytophagaceae bacterium]|nr:T9SS type A sorting domain-containing protein [Cytophagaceae bacterium]